MDSEMDFVKGGFWGERRRWSVAGRDREEPDKKHLTLVGRRMRRCARNERSSRGHSVRLNGARALLGLVCLAWVEGVFRGLTSRGPESSEILVGPFGTRGFDSPTPSIPLRSTCFHAAVQKARGGGLEDLETPPLDS